VATAPPVGCLVGGGNGDADARADGDPHPDVEAGNDEADDSSEDVATSKGTATSLRTAVGAAAVATGVVAPLGGAPVVVRSRGRSRWFVVEADPADPEHGPVAVVSGHTSQKAATAALGRARSRARSRPWSGVGEGAVLQVRAADQISSRLVWDSQAGRGVVHPGPPP